MTGKERRDYILTVFRLLRSLTKTSFSLPTAISHGQRRESSAGTIRSRAFQSLPGLPKKQRRFRKFQATTALHSTVKKAFFIPIHTPISESETGLNFSARVTRDTVTLFSL